MQISNSLLVTLTAVAAVWVTSSAWAADADTDAQTKAREALRLKMQEMEQPYEAFAPAPKDSAELSKAREALRRKMAQLDKDPSQAASSPAEARALRDAKRAAPPQEFPAFQAPASPLSADQRQKLAELLERYKADELTPEQYHRERGKIITGK